MTNVHWCRAAGRRLRLGREQLIFHATRRLSACLSVGSSNKLGRIQLSTALLAVHKLYRGSSGEISPMSKLRFASNVIHHRAGHTTERVTYPITEFQTRISQPKRINYIKYSDFYMN